MFLFKEICLGEDGFELNCYWETIAIGFSIITLPRVTRKC